MISVCARVSKNIQHVLSVFKTSSDDLNTLSTGTRRFMFLIIIFYYYYYYYEYLHAG